MKEKARVPSSVTVNPPDKESKHLDFIGKRTFSSAGSLARISNTQILMCNYQFELLEKAMEYSKNEEFQKFMEEAILSSRHILRSALDMADLSSRVMAQGVSLRRHAWLRPTGFRPDLQAKIEGLLFDGTNLFTPEADSMLAEFKTPKVSL